MTAGVFGEEAEELVKLHIDHPSHVRRRCAAKTLAGTQCLNSESELVVGALCFIHETKEEP